MRGALALTEVMPTMEGDLGMPRALTTLKSPGFVHIYRKLVAQKENHNLPFVGSNLGDDLYSCTMSPPRESRLIITLLL